MNEENVIILVHPVKYLMSREDHLMGVLVSVELPAIPYFFTGLLLLLLATLLVVARRYRKGTKRVENAEKQLERLHGSLIIYEQEMARLEDRNEWLLTEMQHRVKNNLQVMNSLFNSQLSYISHPAGREALMNSRHRLYALSLVYQKNLETEMVSSLDLAWYLRELADYLLDEFRGKGRIVISFNLVPLTIDLSAAVPLGLIVNELLSNALKFAFPQGRSGHIIIRLAATREKRYCLCISDNGVGVPNGLDFESGGTLGGSLVTGLARQMKAKLDIKIEQGVNVTVDFNVPEIPELN